MSAREKKVRALQRGLAILESLDFSESLDAVTVARRVRLPRATVQRLLITLESEGYVARDSSSGAFRLADPTAGLGDGLDAGVLLGLVSGPVLVDLYHSFKWPADVLTFERGGMIIQESTNARRPRSLDPNRIGCRFSAITSVAGQAFLAACNPDQRERAFLCIRQLGDPDERKHVDEPAYLGALAQVRERGYALRHGHESKRKTSSLAVAIMQSGWVWGSLCVRWLDSTLEHTAAVDQLLPAIKNAATRIAAQIG